jgi:electron transfer flavoprotein beta subunit
VKLAVCVKEVPEASARTRIDPATFRLDRSGAATLNPFDAHALEEGLRIRERTGEGEVVALMMAPARAADSLRKALAIGADRAVHIVDDELTGSDLVPTARALAKAVEREEPDLVLLGQQGGDSDGAVLWSALADLLRLPVVSQAASLELGEGKVTAKRQTEYGYDVIDAPLPAVVAVSDAINEPRYPSLKGIMGAKKKPFETLGAADLGLAAEEVGEPGSRTDVRALADPPSRGESFRIEDDGSAAEKLVEYLAERKLV